MNVQRIHALVLLAALAPLALAATAARAADEHGAAKVEAGKSEAVESHTGGHAAAGEDEPNLLRPASEGLITALTTLIVFGALVVVLGKTAWGPIAKGLQDREDKIRRDIEEAEAARARAEATQREYQQQLAAAEAKVRELLAKATTDAEQIANSIRTRAQTEAQETKENATREIQGAQREAIRQVHEQAAVLSTRIAEKILRRNLNADDQRDLVAASLDQVETIKG
jgi:F-type H+-transporting ATPase subunit b